MTLLSVLEPPDLLDLQIDVLNALNWDPLLADVCEKEREAARSAVQGEAEEEERRESTAQALLDVGSRVCPEVATGKRDLADLEGGREG